MSEVTWKMRTVDDSPYTGTVIFGQNEGDQKWIFIRNSCSIVMTVELLAAGQTQRIDIDANGIGGFLVPAEAYHDFVEIGLKTDDGDWNLTYHYYNTGGTVSGN